MSQSAVSSAAHLPHLCYGGPEAGPSAAQLPDGIAGRVKSGTMQVPGKNTGNMILLPVKIAGVLPAQPGICVRYGRHSVPALSLMLPAADPSLWSAVRDISDVLGV
jgi:hypothetical protein